MVHSLCQYKFKISLYGITYAVYYITYTIYVSFANLVVHNLEVPILSHLAFQFVLYAGFVGPKLRWLTSCSKTEEHL